MNQKQLLAAQAAGETVAFSLYDGIDNPHASEVMIVNAKTTRVVYTGRSFHGHRAPGVEITFVNSGANQVVTSQQLVATWADYVEHQQKRNEQLQTRKQRAAASKVTAERQAEQVKAIFAEVMGEPSGGWYGKVEVVGNGHRAGNHWIETTAYSVKMSPDVLAVLLDDRASGILEVGE